MLDLTAFVLTQNNIRTIADCLDSLTWCENVVVIDSYSDDGSLKIISQYPNVKVFQHQYTTAREQRIWGMSFVKTQWVFIIDSDEVCTPQLRDKIMEIVKSKDDTHDGYLFHIRTMFFGGLMKHKDYMSSKGKRLVQTKIATRYHRAVRVHASIMLDNPKTMPKDIYLIHNPITSLKDQFAKMSRYASWQAEDMFEKGVKPRWWHFTLRPIGKFLQFFIIARGFRDGFRGLIICCLAGLSVLLKYMYLYELCQKQGDA